MPSICGGQACQLPPKPEELSPPPPSDRTPPLLCPGAPALCLPDFALRPHCCPRPRGTSDPGPRAPLPKRSTPPGARGSSGRGVAPPPGRRHQLKSPARNPGSSGEASLRACWWLARAFSGAGFGVLASECLCPHPGVASGEPLLAAWPQPPGFLEQNCIWCQTPLPTLELKLSMIFFFFLSFSQRRDTG